jgi:hypothetical protein
MVVLALFCSGVSALAQQAPPPPPQGCTAPEYRQFDYWIGDWNVTDSSGTRTYGSNRITSEESGCLIHEHWRAAGGGTGQSFTFYDRVTRRWEQVWVASGGGILRLSGKLDGTSMVLEGPTVSPTGAPVLNRIAWIPQPDGRVRQLWSRSTDQGTSWQAGFDGWYRKRP